MPDEHEPETQRGRPRAFNPSPEQTTIQALDRAVVILKVLAEGEGMSLTELAEASGQAPATVYRVLSTFEAHGIVEVQPATQLWFVGQEAFRIGSAFLGRTSLVEQARGVMHGLMAETGRDGEPRDRRRRAGGLHQPGRDARADPGVLPAGDARADPCQRHRQGAARLPSAGGGGADRARAGAARPSPRGRSPTRRALGEELAAIRARGWAMDDEERTEGMRCIAAPIFNEFREAIAGVSISGPTVRMERAGGEALGAQGAGGRGPDHPGDRRHGAVSATRYRRVRRALEPEKRELSDDRRSPYAFSSPAC